MHCTKCGKQIQAGAAFCMHCGKPLAVQAAQPIAMPAMAQAAPAFPNPDAISSRKTTTVAIVTALALILALFLGLKASGILKFGASNPKLDTLQAKGQMADQNLLGAEGQDPKIPLLQAQGQEPQIPLMRAEGNQGPQTLAEPAQKIEMPADVRRWLEHLEKIEKRKNDLSMKQIAQMTVLMQRMKVLGAGMGMLNGEDDEGGNLEPSGAAKQEFDDLRPEWNQLLNDFRSFPPPAECRPIADDYYRAVSEIPGMNADLADILQNVSTDPAAALEKVMKLQNTSANVIDRYLGTSDAKVGDICRKYETRKWFDIKTDVGGGLMSKFGI
jgi:hypothetical protein